MKEQLISFKTAKLAKEKGFDWETKLGYCTTNDVYPIGYVIINTGYGCLSAPTQSLLQKWLREECKINIQIESSPEFNDWIYTIWEKDFCYYIADGDGGDTYEKALEEGLLEALKLIKKAKL